MAKVYSWEVVKSSVYAYIVDPNDISNAYVGPVLKGDNLNKVIDWAAGVSEEEYIAHFELMKTLCKEKGYDVNFDSAEAYLNVVGSCDNLRGPAGRGIKRIYYKNGEDGVDAVGRVICYYGIEYDDGSDDDEFFIINGIDGKNGVDGIKGEDGITGISSKFAVIYTTTETEVPPERPVGGSYNFHTNEFKCPSGWFVNDDNLVGIKWMSTKTFTSVDDSEPWSDPIRISGKDGENGRDGDSIEFIYKLGDDVENPPAKPANNKAINDYIPEGWRDHPWGVSEDYPVEWMCSRTKGKDKNGNETWGDWTDPIAWSVFGVNGTDGDGVQYIFFKNKGEMPANPTPKNWDSKDSSYQVKYEEYIPPINEGYENYNGEILYFTPAEDDEEANIWLDSPSNLSVKYQYQWVCVRRYNGKEERWDKFSTPALWGKFGENGSNGTAIIKIYKTDTSLSEPPLPPPGENAAIIGDWSMGFPSDFELGKNVVYCTEAEIYIDNYNFVYRYRKMEASAVTEDIKSQAKTFDTLPTEKQEDYDYIYYGEAYYHWTGGWCKPYIVTGIVGEKGASSKLVAIYKNCDDDEIPETPVGGSYDFKELQLLDKPEGWDLNDDDHYGITWMSTRTFSEIEEYTDEEWSTPIRLTGEKAPENKFIMIYTQSLEQPATPADGDYDFKTRTFTCPEGWFINDDGFINVEGESYTWMSTRTFSSAKIDTQITGDTENTTTIKDKWSTPIRLTGKDGQDGRDGESIEFIYIQSDREPKETDKPSEPDYISEGWSDHPNGVTEELPYEWMCTRTRSKEPNKNNEYEWSEWVGPVVWSKYGVNGKDGDGVQYIYLRTQTDEYTPPNPTPKTWDKISEYQNKYSEWIPTEDKEYVNINNQDCLWEDDYVWTDSPQEVNSKYKYVWVCVRKFKTDEVKISTGEKINYTGWHPYSRPVVWSKYAEDGQDGRDGQSIEFIYKQSNKKPTAYDKPSEPENKVEPDYIPKDWSDHPNGVTEELPYEWMCTRTLNQEPNEYNEYEWSEWVGPVVWSKYGVNGKDGDGVQYIYLRTQTDEAPKNPTPITWEVSDVYQDKYAEWIPPTNEEYLNIDNEICNWSNTEWTDSVPEISKDEKYIWMSLRKYRDTLADKWQQCSYPVLIHQKGQQIEFIYKRSNRKPTPTDKPQNDEVIEGWSSTALNATKDEPYVWVCSYIQKNDNRIYSEPILYSIYNNKIEYIYYWTDDEKTPDNPTPESWLNNVFYQRDGWTYSPSKSWFNTKEPLTNFGITNTNTYVWLFTRTFEPASMGNRWQAYTEPKLWAKYPEEGLRGPEGPSGIPGVSFEFMYTLGTNLQCFGMSDIQNQTENYPLWFPYDEIPSYEIVNYDVKSGDTLASIKNSLSKIESKLASNIFRVVLENSNVENYLYVGKYIEGKGRTIQDVTTYVNEDETKSVYIWCIQGKEEIEKDDKGEIKKDENNNPIISINWGTPFKLQGANGLKGMDGDRSPIIYPMGIYSSEVKYVATKEKQPYVYDGSGNGKNDAFYVYNNLNKAWIGKLEGNETPTQHVANGGTDWVKLDSFEAFYANVGIINNGLIGSAVFNNNFMFSQQGLDKDDGTGKYEQFLNGYTYKNDKWYYDDGITEVSKETGTGRYLLNPYEKTDTGKYIHDFRPNVCINFETGEMWCGCGALYLYKGVVNVEESYLGTPPEQITNENTEGNNTAFDHPIKEGTGIFKGWNMEKFLGTPPMWDEKTGDKYEGTGVFKPVTTYIGTTPTINEDGSIAINGTGVLGKSIKTVTDYVGTPPTITSGGTVEGGSGVLRKVALDTRDYVGTPSTITSGGTVEGGSGVLRKVALDTCEYIGTPPSISSDGTITNGTGLLNTLTTSVVDYVGTPASVDNNGNLKSGTGLLGESMTTISDYIGTPAECDDNGDMTDGGTGLLKKVNDSIGTIPTIDSNGNVAGGSGRLQKITSNITNYIGTPTSYSDDGSKGRDGTGLLLKVSNAMINYVGELPSVDSSGDLSNKKWGMLGKFADTLNNYIGTPPSYNGGNLNLGSGLLSKTTSGIKNYIGQVPAMNNGETAGGAGVLKSLSTTLLEYIGKKPSIDSSGDMISGSGLLGDSIKVVSEYIGTPPTLNADGSVKVQGTGKFKDIYDEMIVPITNPLKTQLDAIGQPARVTSQGTTIGGTGLLAGLTQTSIDGKTGYTNMTTTNMTATNMTVNNLSLSGFMLKKPTEINNINDYVLKNKYGSAVVVNNIPYLDINKCGSYINYKANSSSFLWLPGTIGGNTYHKSDDVRQYIGQTFAIYNNANSNDVTIGVTGSILSGQSYVINKGRFLIATCVCDVVSDKERISWNIVVGTQTL